MSQERFVIPAKDEHGNIAGFTSVSRDCILDVGYSIMEHNIIITLKSQYTKGASLSDLIPVLKKEQGVTKQIKGSFKQEVLYRQEGYNHTIAITVEEDMKSFWNWLNVDNKFTFDVLLEARSKELEKIKIAKEAAELAAKEADGEKKENEFKDEKITDNNLKSL